MTSTQALRAIFVALNQPKTFPADVAYARRIAKDALAGLEDPSQGNWYPACNGTEEPFTSRSGRRLLYCYQPSTGRHAYIDLSTDIALSDDEAREALAIW